MNEEYEHWADDIGIGILEYFTNKYRGIKIEIPKLREKSQKSLLGKIKNLQIERLSKLYAIEGISDKEKTELYLQIEERIYENEELDAKHVLEIIKKLIYGQVEEIQIEEFEQAIMIEGISKSTKTALLRILFGKIEKSSNSDKNRQLQILEEKYGEIAANKSGIPEKDIIHYSSIRNIIGNNERIERLRDEHKFLKANDLRGMKIVVVDIPDDFKTDNDRIKQILEKRKNARTSEERVIYTHNCIVEIGKEFYRDLANNKELLNNLNIRVIPDSNKHKKKSNGYEAEHIKFFDIDEPEYTLELQFKSEYVETICRGEGTAAHENRPGKRRVLPEANSDRELIQRLGYMVPKYKIFQRENGRIKAQKFSMLKNILGYYQEQMPPRSEEYEKILKIFYCNNNEKEIAI